MAQMRCLESTKAQNILVSQFSSSGYTPSFSTEQIERARYVVPMSACRISIQLRVSDYKILITLCLC